MTDINPIKNNFSKAAVSYDRYAHIQKHLFITLLGMVLAAERLDSTAECNVLDAGCGTGVYTLNLIQSLKKASITALDLSAGMVNEAKKKLEKLPVKFIVDDIEKVDLNDKFDLIFSNAAFQWVLNFEELIIKLKKQLSRNGVIAFSVFGPRTFSELKNVLTLVVGEPVTIAASSFLHKEDIQRSLQKHFSNVEVRQEILQNTYPDLKVFLETIKRTGTRGKGFRSNLWTPGFFNEVEEIYKEMYKLIMVTYEVYYCIVY
ncbi:MAG: malonyl-ACP O-methyltransferase BioC [bacterium]|nr:malonyl-ACP O-methyltransferase BioC [bacterium]